MKKICVFCGSSQGNNPRFQEMARELASLLVEEKMGLVYGGATVGLMAEVAEGVLSKGGEVHGVIPEALFSKEIPHRDLTKLHSTQTMHERKQLMYDLSDGFIALPGGLGTLDELLEVLSWAQLGLHQKPIGVLNVAGYFDPLIELLEQGVRSEFMHVKHKKLLMVAKSPKTLIKRFREYQPSDIKKWILEEDR